MSDITHDPRDQPRYTVAQVARYVRVPPSTVLSWATGDAPLIAAVPTPPGAAIQLSFLDLVEAYALTVIRRCGSPSRARLQQAMARVAAELGEVRPLLSSRFATEGIRVYLAEIARTLAADDVAIDGAEVPDAIAAGLARIEHDETGVVRVFPFVVDPHEPMTVAIDPARGFGRPTIAGTRVGADVVASLADAGDPPDRIAAELGITEESAIRAADWHRSLSARWGLVCSCHP